LSYWQTDRSIVEARATAFNNAFPKCLGARTTTTIQNDYSANEDGEEYTTYNVDIIIPKRCRIAAVIEDIDYTSPIRMNGFALARFGWTLVTGHLMRGDALNV
jgi:hypothetical protein